MGKIIVRRPVKNKTSYKIPGLTWEVYSPEELVYSYYQNLQLLEEAVMDDKLPSWLEGQGKAELAKKLKAQINGPKTARSMEAFLVTVLEGVTYYSSEEIARAKAFMAEWGQADPYVRRKEKLDFLLEKKRIYEAIRGYERLFKELENERAEPASLQAAVLHNLGAAYGRLFLFDKAAEAFKKAWKLSGAEEAKELYMLSLRMSLPKKDYVYRIAEEHLGEEEAVELEEKLLEILKKEEKSENRLRLEAVKQQKDLGNQALYEVSLKELISGLKKQWRNGNGDF